MKISEFIGISFMEIKENLVSFLVIYAFLYDNQ